MSEAQKLIEAKKELEKWTKLLEAADTIKSRLVLEKTDTDIAKKDVQHEINEIMDVEERNAASCAQKMQEMQDEISRLNKKKQDLLEKLLYSEEQLKSKKAETDTLQQRFKIKAQIPEKKMKFTHVEKVEETQDNESQDIRAVFTTIQRPSFLLNKGQALITFEDEKVAEQILGLSKCSVACDRSKIEVRPCSVALEPSVKFQVHIRVSKKTMEFSNVPPVLSEDRLELDFSKPSRCGGEVEKLEYDPKTGSGRVTFLNTGVAEILSRKGRYYIGAGNDIEISVAPQYEFQLKKFQTFLGVPKRTVLLNGTQVNADEEDLQDHLEIHFQKPSNYGGEVETIKYTGKTLRAIFSEDCAEIEAQ